MSEYRRRSLRVFFLTTYCLALALSVHSQTAAPSTASLLYPPYHDLPTVEGYFPGADNVRLFYRMVGTGKKTIVFLHGGPGVGIEDGALDLEGVAAKGFRFIELNERGGGPSVRSSLAKNKSQMMPWSISHRLVRYATSLK